VEKLLQKVDKPRLACGFVSLKTPIQPNDQPGQQDQCSMVVVPKIN
jgi:hypothetical protein